MQLAPELDTDLMPALAQIRNDEQVAPSELLGDPDFEDLPDLSDWLRAERHKWRDQRDAGLSATAAACEREGAVARGLVYVQCLKDEFGTRPSGRDRGADRVLGRAL